MSKDSYINMKESNFPEPEEDRFEERKILAHERVENGEIMIWYIGGIDEGMKTIFVTFNNVTINIPETEFYTFTKLTQAATKKLLNIDD